MEKIAQNPCPWCQSREAVIRDGMFICPRCSYQKDVSGPHELRVIGWTTADDKGYREISCCTEEIYDAIVAEIQKNGYLFGAFDHDSGALPCTPVINNGCKIVCGQRFWAKLMGYAHGGEAGEERYMEYYGFLDAPVYPPKGVDVEKIVPFELDV